MPGTRSRGKTGICVSGGGIRSACVTLGALQSLREAGILDHTRYLVSVSGGGYMAGALQLALQRSADPPIPAGSPKDAFAPGSVEEDHLRRHGKYIAESAREWSTALLVLLRNLLASLTVQLTTVVVVGLALYAFYEFVPVAAVTTLQQRVVSELAADESTVSSETGETSRSTEDEQTTQNAPTARGAPAQSGGVDNAADSDAVPLLTAPAAWAVGTILGAATLLWVAAWFTSRQRLALGSMRMAVGLTAAGAAVAVVTVIIPFLSWVSVQVLVVGLDLDVPQIASLVGGGASALAYLGALVTILWRRREQVGKAGNLFSRLRGGVQPLEREVATGLTQSLIVWAVLALLSAVFLLVLGFTVVHAHTWDGWILWLVPIGLGVAVLFVDQTALSLHPFYRRRLASAFAVRRQLLDGDAVARPYDFLRETTTLSTYGCHHGQSGAPHIIFGAAAAMSGAERTPPGRRAVSFTFSYDYVGGPEVGWVRTQVLEQRVSPRICRDLTVQTAMAVSGAAFASSMGRQARAFQTLLALSNARLGTWLPNPAYLSELIDDRNDRRTPPLPRLRRLPYLLREVIGSYPFDERLLLCTDGGHYENLGLVELLRHGCKTIYCIDASGDAPPFATTLAETITLAWEELGVRIVSTTRSTSFPAAQNH